MRVCSAAYNAAALCLTEKSLFCVQRAGEVFYSMSGHRLSTHFSRVSCAPAMLAPLRSAPSLRSGRMAYATETREKIAAGGGIPASGCAPKVSRSPGFRAACARCSSPATRRCTCAPLPGCGTRASGRSRACTCARSAP